MSGSKEELPQLIEKLKISSDEETVKILLKNITEKLQEHLEDSAELVSQLEKITASNVPSSVIIQACKSIAELAKTPEGRAQCCQSKSLVSTIAKHLGSTDMELASQACRALGNLCYENDEGRKIVISAGCLPVLIEMLKKGLEEKEKGKQLRNTASGFLLNLLMDQEELQTEAFNLGIMPILNQLLQVDGTDHETESCSNHTLLILGLFIDSELKWSEGNLLDETLCKTIVSLLGASTSPELSEMCLELLHGQADNELVKMRLARVGLCELLVSLIDTHKGEVDSDDKRNLLKLACDLIVLVLTGDESMDILYQESQGKLFHSMINWLQDSDEDLQITAVLAMGNFARTDKHCTQIVDADVATKLLEILKTNNTCNDNIRLQHALLSALRNLVIPISNKSAILKAGLVEALLPMLEITAFPVVFKLLGTLRIVIDGQVEAAKNLGIQETLIKRLVEWCGTQDHPGIQGEASRLLAWLVKHSRDQKVVKTLVKLGALPPLVRMIDTEHPIMQNEALIALNLFALLALRESENDLIENELGQKIIALIKKYTDKTNSPQTESLQNILTLITQLLQSENFKSHFIDNDIRSSLISLKTLENMPDLDNKLNTMNKLLNSA